MSTSAPNHAPDAAWLSVSGIQLQEKDHVALRGISFGQPQFQKLALAGETGAGKSTLLQIIAGLIQPSGGEVRLEGRRVKGPTEQLMPGHPGVAYLSQHFELPKFLRVEQVLRYATRPGGPQAPDLYELCRISHLAPRQTSQLSGGERQRIALARLLLASPRLLLLDEPFSNLDREHKRVLKSVIEDLSQQLGITCLLVSHDPTDTLSWADQLLVLRAGSLIQQGSPLEIYQQPVDAYTAGLFGDYNLITGRPVSAFSKLAGTKAKSQQLLIRPESFQLKAPTGGQLGTVRTVRFFGSYSEVEVELLGTNVIVKTSEPGLQPGSEVRVSLPKANVWFIP